MPVFCVHTLGKPSLTVPRFLARFLWQPYKRTCFYVLGMIFLSAVSFLYFGYGLRVMMDHYQEADAHVGFLVFDIFVLLISLAFVFFVASYVRIYLLTWVSEKVFSDVRVHIFEKFLHCPALHIRKLSASDFNTRFNNDKAILETALSNGLPLALRNIFITAGSTFFLFLINKDLTLFFMFWIVVMVVVSIYFRPMLSAIFQAYQKTLTDIGSHMELFVRYGFSLKFFSLATLTQRFTHISQNSLHVGIVQVVGRLKSIALTSFIGFLAIASSFAFGFEEIYEKKLSYGQLASYFFYATTVMGYVTSLTENFIEMIQSSGALKRLVKLLNMPQIKIQPSLFVGNGHVTWQQVSFRSGDHLILDNLNASFRAGDKVGIVGPPISGKTTLLHLMAGSYRPSSGIVNVGGYDPCLLHKDVVWRSCVSFLNDDIPLFSGTLKENMLFDAAFGENVLHGIVNALDPALLLSFDKGLDTVLLPGGSNLSYTQKLFIFWTRVLIKDPHLLFLDDGTFTSYCPLIIRQQFLGPTSHKTVFLVTRDAAWLEAMDHVVFLHKQRAYVGSHDALMAHSAYKAFLCDHPKTG
ncbi:ABC transporter transmembrane domain-containing protein [Candidatus Hepatobacter penaei]|uniref:ABC transporter transmembrane domain-containing protein n=1 Tax=Candidatus Hepatobacter penaei TaxID=1274402 RepID=UPI001C11AE31|nr:ABC transporter ATP-binding protein [Candidatus Hepatobacter penaei]